MKTRNILILAALCAMAGQTFAAPKEVAPTPAALQARLAKMAPDAKVECHKDSHGYAACTADGYDVVVTGCEGDMFFGQVTDDAGATVNTRLSGPGGKDVAHMEPQQFVCIAAVAKKDNKRRFYVEALPTERVPGCKSNDLCQTRPVRWIGTPPDEKCAWVGSDGEFTGGCVAGWVDEKMIEEFSMGLH